MSYCRAAFSLDNPFSAEGVRFLIQQFKQDRCSSLKELQLDRSAFSKE